MFSDLLYPIWKHPLILQLRLMTPAEKKAKEKLSTAQATTEYCKEDCEDDYLEHQFRIPKRNDNIIRDHIDHRLQRARFCCCLSG